MNIKKIGLTALAGSLAMVSAQAVDLAVTGKTEVTYVTKDNASTGNPFGNGNMISFAGSGDVNGMTATYEANMQDGGQGNTNTSEVFASSGLTLDMGDFGKIGIDNGVGTFGASLPQIQTGEPTVQTYSFTLELSSPLGNALESYNIVVANQNAPISAGGPGFPGNSRIPTVLNTRPATFDIATNDPTNYGYYIFPNDDINTTYH